MPAVEVDGEPGLEEGELLADAAQILLPQVQIELGCQEGEGKLLDGADLVSGGIENFQTMPPGELALHGIHGLSGLVINIVAVQPRKESLLEQ